MALTDDLRFLSERLKANKFKPTEREKEVIEYLQTVPASSIIDVGEIAVLLEADIPAARKMFLDLQKHKLVEQTFNINSDDGEYAYKVMDKLYML